MIKIRHFVWAALLTNRLGVEKTKKFLDAHENNPVQPSSEKAMDLANNRAGILVTLKLREKNVFNVDNIKKEAITSLRDKSLVVLIQN